MAKSHLIVNNNFQVKLKGPSPKISKAQSLDMLGKCAMFE
jgi:hypothetical protein